MALFRYHGHTEAGQPKAGTIEAPSRMLATVSLRREGLFIEVLEEVVPEGATRAASPKPSLWDLINPISARHLARFWDQFAQLMHAGVSVHEALLALQGRVAGRIARVLGKMAPAIAAGKSLSDEAAAYPGIFPLYVVGMLQAGETSGELEVIARDLATQYDQDFKAWLRLLPAKIYFSLVLILCVLVPAFPGIVIGADDLLSGLREYLHFAVTRLLPWIAVVLFGLLVLKVILNLPGIKTVKDGVVYGLPLVNRPLLVTGRWRFLRCLQVLIGAGVDLPQAVATAAEATGNEAIAKPFRMVASKMRDTGAGVELLAAVPSLTPEMRNALLTADQAGTYDQALQNLTAQAAEERDSLLRRTTIGTYVVFYVIVIGLVIAALAAAWLGHYNAIFQRFESPEWMP